MAPLGKDTKDTTRNNFHPVVPEEEWESRDMDSRISSLSPSLSAVGSFAFQMDYKLEANIRDTIDFN